VRSAVFVRCRVGADPIRLESAESIGTIEWLPPSTSATGTAVLFRVSRMTFGSIGVLSWVDTHCESLQMSQLSSGAGAHQCVGAVQTAHRAARSPCLQNLRSCSLRSFRANPRLRSWVPAIDIAGFVFVDLSRQLAVLDRTRPDELYRVDVEPELRLASDYDNQRGQDPEFFRCRRNLGGQYRGSHHRGCQHVEPPPIRRPPLAR
jgi:hypothetical protein